MNTPLKDKHPLAQLAAFLGLAIISSIVVSMLGLVFGMVIWDSGFMSSFMSSEQSVINVNHLRYLQFVNQVGIFVIPALIFASLTDAKPLKFLTLNKSAGFINLVIGVLIIVFSQGIISVLAEWNASIKLPESLNSIEKWMQSSEKAAADMTDLLLSGNSVGNLLFNIFLVAAIPAIGEELVFRGIVQKLIQKLIKKGFLSVILTAFVFSFIHFQFYGFVPRFVLGFVLGFAFWKSNKLWIPITMHFVNNGIAVTLYWMQTNKIIDNADNVININDNISIIVISTFLFVSLLLAFNNINKNKTNL